MPTEAPPTADAWFERFVRIVPEISAQLYASRFEEHEVSLTGGQLSEDRLRELGVKIGHRQALNELLASLAAQETASLANAGGGLFGTQSACYSALQSAPFSGSLDASFVLLPDGTEWFDVEGFADSLPEFMKFVRQAILNSEGTPVFPAMFSAAFEGTRPMPFAAFGSVGDAQCGIAALRTSKPDKVDASVDPTTVNDALCDLFFVLLRVDVKTQSSTLYTIHRRPTVILPWLAAIKEDSYGDDVTFVSVFARLVREGASQTALRKVTAIRRRLEVAAATRSTDKPAVTEVVQEILECHRAALSWRTINAANLRVMEEWQSRPEMNMADALVGVLTDLRTVAQVTEEVDAVGHEAIAGRVHIAGFRAYRHLKVITFFSVFTGIVSTVTGWYSMNWRNMPEFTDPDGYVWFLMAMGILSLVILVTLLSYLLEDDSTKAAVESAVHTAVPQVAKKKPPALAAAAAAEPSPTASNPPPPTAAAGNAEEGAPSPSDTKEPNPPEAHKEPAAQPPSSSAESATVEPAPAAQPAASTEPTAQPAASAEPTAQPAASTEPTAQPAASNEPAQPAVSTEPAAQPAAASTEPVAPAAVAEPAAPPPAFQDPARESATQPASQATGPQPAA